MKDYLIRLVTVREDFITIKGNYFDVKAEGLLVIFGDNDEPIASFKLWEYIVNKEFMSGRSNTAQEPKDQVTGITARQREALG